MGSSRLRHHIPALAIRVWSLVRVHCVVRGHFTLTNGALFLLEGSKEVNWYQASCKFWSLGLGAQKKHGNEIGYYGQNELANGTRTDFLAGKEDIFLPAPSV